MIVTWRCFVAGARVHDQTSWNTAAVSVGTRRKKIKWVIFSCYLTFYQKLGNQVLRDYGKCSLYRLVTPSEVRGEHGSAGMDLRANKEPAQKDIMKYNFFIHNREKKHFCNLRSDVK